MFRYIDLFSGIGGFHQGVDRVSRDLGLETECIFAADNDFYASQVYTLNYGIVSHFNLKDQQVHDLIKSKIGTNELTCIFGGFPCQPFSKAGDQQGFGDVTKGTLFLEIEKLVKEHQPKLVLLENVRNLKTHDNGNTWKVIKNTLKLLDYHVDDYVLSPNNISDIPALRERFFIAAYHTKKTRILEMQHIKDKDIKKEQTSIYANNDINQGLDVRFFDTNSDSDVDMHRINVLEMWNALVENLKEKNRKILTPLWPKYFLESHTTTDMPVWKQHIVERNRKWYIENQSIFDCWYNEHKLFYDNLNDSQKKFEWNAKDAISNVWEGIIQFRPSGVRVKKPDYIPTLVAINQTPIIGLERRYIKPSEISKLYGFKGINFNNQPINQTFKQLGNTVSVDVVEYLIKEMLKKSGIGG